MKTAFPWLSGVGLAAALCLWLPAAGYGEEPWSTTPDAPAMGKPAPASQRYAAQPPQTFAKTSSFIWLKMYQNAFSPLVNSSCAMAPSCSNYSLEAIEKHGAFKGIMMTADRLYHEGRVAQSAPIVQTPSKILYIDPVENNVAWRTQ